MLKSVSLLNELFQSEFAVCVFDLDSTLFCVSPRTEKIVQEFVETKKVLKDLKNVKFTPQDWGLKSALERHKITMSQEEFLLLKRYWGERFFSNNYLKYDKIYDRSNDFVNLCSQKGFKIIYLTGRNEERMREGTLEQLKSWGFPLDSEINLLMKTKDFQEDEDFKVQILKGLSQKHSNIYFFENEPVIINQVLNAQLNLRTIYMDSVHSGREKTPIHIDRIEPSIFKEFLDEYSNERKLRP